MKLPANREDDRSVRERFTSLVVNVLAASDMPWCLKMRMSGGTPSSALFGRFFAARQQRHVAESCRTPGRATGRKHGRMSGPMTRS